MPACSAIGSPRYRHFSWMATAMELPKFLRARINRLAHRAGQRHELEFRHEILRRLNQLADAGVAPRALSNELDSIEKRSL